MSHNNNLCTHSILSSYDSECKNQPKLNLMIDKDKQSHICTLQGKSFDVIIAVTSSKSNLSILVQIENIYKNDE